MSTQQRIAELEKENERLHKRIAELEGAVEENTHDNRKSKPSGMEEKENESRQQVLRKIQSRVISFNDLKPEWQDDIELVCAFFQAAPRNRIIGKRDLSLDLGYRVGRKQVKYSELPYHLMANERVLVAALASREGPESWEKEVPIWLRSQPEVISAALEYGTIGFEDVPEELQFDHPQIAYIGVAIDYIYADDVEHCVDDTKWETGIRSTEIDWFQLPSRLQSDLDFARNLVQDPSGFEMAGKILSQVTVLCHDEAIWLSLLSKLSSERSFERHHFQKLLEEFAPIELLSNRSFMATMCARHTDAISLLGNSLEMDYHFLAEVIKDNVHVLQCLSHEAQLAHPTLIVEAFPDLAIPELRKTIVIWIVQRNIAPSLWEDIEFARAWMKAGLDFPDKALDNATLWEWGKDRIISFASITMNRSFRFVARKWLEDEEFMLDVIDDCKDTNVLGEAYKNAPTLRVLIAVCAASREFTARKMLAHHVEGKDENIENLVRYVRCELRAYDTYAECVLGSMLSTKTFQSTGTPLSMLNQGPETALNFKRELAAYLDVPTGKWLRQLRQADLHLRHAVAPWKPNV